MDGSFRRRGKKGYYSFEGARINGKRMRFINVLEEILKQKRQKHYVKLYIITRKQEQLKS